VSVSTDQPFIGKRILVCGKGGSGKSTLVALMANVLSRKSYEVIVLDGDASNPEGLVRLMFGCGVEGEPTPLVEFFGGVNVVTCPVDDPSPLTRLGDSRPIPESRIDIDEELQPAYFLRKGSVTLFQVGKIETYGQGCDGPLEKVVRDFVVKGDAVTLIDIKAGVEHFGRKVPEHADIVIGVIDCTRESVSIAKRMDQFCGNVSIDKFWLIINKAPSKTLEKELRAQLGNLEQKMIGVIHYDENVAETALSGGSLGDCRALTEVEQIVEHMGQGLAAMAIPQAPHGKLSLTVS
jgi:CO dehydrogenase maturation factor